MRWPHRASFRELAGEGPAPQGGVPSFRLLSPVGSESHLTIHLISSDCAGRTPGTHLVLPNRPALLGSEPMPGLKARDSWFLCPNS